MNSQTLKNYKVFLLLGIILLTFSRCDDSNQCPNHDINSFDSFLGLNENSKESDMRGALGTANMKRMNEDRSKLTYIYLNTEDAPISIVFSEATGKIETVMMEVLSLEDNFQTDLDDVAKHYQLDSCDTKFFGMTETTLLSQIIQTPSERYEKDGAIVLNYYNDDMSIRVTFKFYAVQNNVCSTVIVNWYR